MDALMVILGLALLVGAGDALVKGAVALSLKLGIPALIISVTVVAFGTSAPELLISIQAALDEAPGIALGNVVGSNIANVWLVLGIPALIAPIAGARSEAKRNLYVMIAATVLFTLLVLHGQIGVAGGAALLGLCALLLFDSVRQGRRARRRGATVEPNDELDDVDPGMPGLKVTGLILAGLIGLPLGAQFLIDGARGLALSFGISEALIGLTVGAVGTSLPELATTVMAAIRRESDVAIGNVVGSNLFNITAVIGAAAMFHPLDVPLEIRQRDIWVMIAATLTLVPYILISRELCRWTGGIFLGLYVGYVVLAFAGSAA